MRKFPQPTIQAAEMRSYFARKGIKNKDIAEALGLSAASVSNMLAGRDPMGKQRAQALHEAYGFDIGFLLTGVGSLIPGEGNSYAAPPESEKPPEPPRNDPRADTPPLEVNTQWLTDLSAMMKQMTDLSNRVLSLQSELQRMQQKPPAPDPEKERLWDLVDRLTRAGVLPDKKDGNGENPPKD